MRWLPLIHLCLSVFVYLLSVCLWLHPSVCL